MPDNLNHLYYGDNLDVLRYLPDNSVDLIYLDPPFNSRQDYNVLFAEKDGSRSASREKQQGALLSCRVELRLIAAGIKSNTRTSFPQFKT